MTIDRAIEILDPEHREWYDSIETINEACRMGMEALKTLASQKSNADWAYLPPPAGMEQTVKSKQTKALGISPETKHRVYLRDGCRCVWCGSTDALPEAYYIRRSWGGLGVEQNILTLCRACHYRFDSGPTKEREEMTEFFRRYLHGTYGEGWNENELYYGRTKQC